MLYKRLKVWQKSRVLSFNIYKLTKKFPSDERFGLVSQMRRCSVSIMSNIAEGHARRSDKSFLNFLNIARGSLCELDSQLLLSRDLGYVNDDKISDINREIITIDKMLNGLIKRFS